MATTKKPSGLTIKRSGLKFTINWKIADKDYANGQQLQFAVFTSQAKFESAINFIRQGFTITKGITWQNVSVGASATKGAFTLSASAYFPTAKKPYLAGIIVRVRGNRKAYTEKEKYKDSHGRTKYRDVTVNPGWSAWAYKGFDIVAPAAPSTSINWSEEFTNRTTFGWDAGEEQQTAPFTRCEYQTITALDYNGKVENMPGWKNATSTNVGRNSSIYRDEADLADKNLTRAYRVRAVGPGGVSAWRYRKHAYGAPNEAINVTCEATRIESAGSYHLVISWDAPAPTSNPIDKTTAEYLIAEPAGIADGQLIVPGEAQWTPFSATKDTSGTNSFSYDLPTTLAPDQCLWIHVVTTHDNHDTPSEAVLAVEGNLANPTITNLQTEASTYRAEITITPGTSVPGAFHAIVYEPADGSENPDAGKIIGIIENGMTSAQVQCPEWSSTPGFGVYAVAGTVESYYERTSDGVFIYTLNEIMTSGVEITGGQVPQAPTRVTAQQIGTTNAAQVVWDVPWKAATGAEVSWADHEDAWWSTEQPQTFEVENLKESKLNVTGLELGKFWYFRVRLYKTNASGTDIFGPYSETVKVDLSTIPAVPELTISDADGIIAPTGSVVASWIYVSADGTRQKAATLAEYTEVEGKPVYEPLVQLSTQQQATLNAETLKWANGTQHDIVVQVTSESGNPSEWSARVTITIADAIECEITSTNLVSETIDDELVAAMKSLPLTVNVTGAGTGGQTNVTIERAEDYDLDRPDETRENYFEGAMIAQVQQPGDGQIEIGLEDLHGRHLDDGARYRITASVRDSAGQTAKAEPIEFIVSWSKQATIPDGTVELQNGIAIITPTAGTGGNADDTVDIYRLSSDEPELIIKDGTFGTQYVDPYPTLNEHGGYRIVTKTVYGDYITAGNEFAWTDIRTLNDSLFQYIDFDGNQLELRYNAELSASGTKQFTATHYLGGSIQGDWLEGATREASVNGVVLRDIDQDTYRTLRALMRYSGICHVRTTDGANFTANVNVQSGSTYNSPGHPESVSLTITRVDNPRADGMTLAEWQPEEE